MVAPLVATPLAFRLTAEPKFTPSILNWTLPLGVPVPGDTAVTVAVNVTDWPDSEGFVEELNAIEVAALFTVWLKLLEVLVLKLVSPP